MEIFLPVANMSVNVFVIVGLGALVGLMSGMFGVGGGFLLTPLLMMYGIPPAVAVASDSTQIVAGSASGAYAHKKLGNVDMKLGLLLLAGGISGGTVGVQIVKILRSLGNFEFFVKLVYVVVLGVVGGLMLRESLVAIRNLWLRQAKHETIQELQERQELKDLAPLLDQIDREITAEPEKQSFWQRVAASLPFQADFKRAGMRTSILFPFALGLIVGILAAIMGVGGGFIMVPSMIYILGMRTVIAVGTDLFQIVFTSTNVAFQQAWQNHTVDIMLVILLFTGSTIGAQFGARIGTRIKGPHLRLILSVIVLAVMAKLLFDLLMAPDSLIGFAGASGGGH